MPESALGWGEAGFLMEGWHKIVPFRSSEDHYPIGYRQTGVNPEPGKG